MTRRDLETLLLTLESTPALIRRASEGMSRTAARCRPAGGGFSLVENVWHLADLEREGFGARIRRILSEDEPALANFDGDRIARERDYQSRSLSAGLAAFEDARRSNVEILRALEGAAWDRSGTQEGVGVVTLADLPRRMAEHDRSHTTDVARLLDEMGRPGRTEPCPPLGMHRVSAVA